MYPKTERDGEEDIFVEVPDAQCFKITTSKIERDKIDARFETWIGIANGKREGNHADNAHQVYPKDGEEKEVGDIFLLSSQEYQDNNEDGDADDDVSFSKVYEHGMILRDTGRYTGLDVCICLLVYLLTPKIYVEDYPSVNRRALLYAGIRNAA